MTLTNDITQTELTRQERVFIWMRRQNLSFSDIARRFGVTSVSVGRWFGAETLSTRRLAQLRDLGIPAELLPRAEDVNPGPRPSSRRDSSIADPAQ